MDLVETSLQSLEWQRFLSVYAGHCYSEAGRHLATLVPPADTQARAEELLARTQEALALIDKESYSFFETLPAVLESIERLSKEQILDGKELINIQKLLDVTALAKEQVAKNAKVAPKTWNDLVPVDHLPRERRAIESTLEPDGRVKDSASPELRSLRHQETQLHREARDKLDKLLQSAFRDGYLQDRFYDVRDGRYLVPVKTEHRHKVSGFIMESSHTKATVFVEPAALREVNDRLKQIQHDIEEEIYRILCALCEQLFPASAQLQINFEAMIDLELALGRARHAQSLASARGSSFPAFGDELYLEGLYHPLLPLVLKNDQIIRNAFILEKGKRVLVISGPNTGGKTVLLKALGLSALMARAGFYLPCAGDARLPFFSKVLAQIGDSQSIEQSLSSFSGSVRGILEIVRLADQQTLILVDEIFHSTDPDEAAALSQSILNFLHERGSTAVVTTHLNGLKVSNSERFGNASMEFSSDTMRPTYRLRMGIPGSSRAIEIAQHLGLPEDLALNAREFLGQNQQRYDELLNTLEDRERKLSEALEKLSAEQTLVSAEQERVTKLQEQLKHERQNFQTQAREKLREQEREATQKLEDMIQEYKSKLQDLNAKQSAAIEAKAKLTELKQSFATETKATPEETVSVGDDFELRGSVYVQHLKNQGTLLSDPANRSRPAEVQVGTLRLKVDWDKLTPLNKKGKPIVRRAVVAEPAECPPELNIIGRHRDEALSAVESYVDQAARSGRPNVRIVHGHGNGILRKAVREFLRKSPYGVKFRPGANSEGGEGCTVVEFDR